MKLRVILSSLVFYAVIAAAYGQEYCPYDDTILTQLHKHAVLQNHVFNQPPRSTCTDAYGQSLSMPNINDFVFLYPADTDDVMYWRGVRATLGVDELSVYTYVPGDRHLPRPGEPHRYFLACPASGPIHFLISLSVTMRNPLRWVGVRRPQYIVHVLGELAVDDETMITNHIPGDNLEVRRVRNMENHRDSLFFVRGIQREQFLKNVNAVLKDVFFDDTCPFDFAVAAVKHIAQSVVPDGCRECGDPRYTDDDATLFVVGHSMGGSAIQYIAQDYAQDPSEYGNVVMESYSFNSYGTRVRASQYVNPNRNYSYCTERDFACERAQNLGRKQPGTYVTYYPDPSNDGVADGHTIADVQQQLCFCRGAYGRVSVTQ